MPLGLLGPRELGVARLVAATGAAATEVLTAAFTGAVAVAEKGSDTETTAGVGASAGVGVLAAKGDPNGIAV